MKKVAIVQSNYIPWKGYFDLISTVDEFVLFDDCQYTKRDWRNRNLIKTPSGLQWLTIPILTKGKFTQTIKETKTQGHEWRENHWKTIQQNYRKAEHFSEVKDFLEYLYLGSETDNLSELNMHFLKEICKFLGLETLITKSSMYKLSCGKNETLANICKQAGASQYVSGPSAKKYLDESIFLEYGISVRFFDYVGYRAYSQLWGEFVHEVSIVDLLLNCGINSRRYLARTL